MTYNYSTRTTCAVVYGCSDANRNIFHGRLSLCESLSHHPLALPTIFAEIERDRMFKKVKLLVTNLFAKAVNISKFSTTSSRLSIKSLGTNPTDSNSPVAMAESSEELMKLWISVSALKRGLETWKNQLEKMLCHCQRLTFENAAGTTTVNANNTGSYEPSPRQKDDIEDLKLSGERIELRLGELIGEYEEKIRECATIIDGMILATQLVRQ